MRTAALGNSANTITATVLNCICYPVIPQHLYKVVCCDSVAVHTVMYMSVKVVQRLGIFA
jgi:hypothetical protein